MTDFVGDVATTVGPTGSLNIVGNSSDVGEITTQPPSSAGKFEHAETVAAFAAVGVHGICSQAGPSRSTANKIAATTATSPTR